MPTYKIVKGELIEVEQIEPPPVQQPVVPIQEPVNAIGNVWKATTQDPHTSQPEVEGRKVRKMKGMGWYVINCPACGEHVIAVNPPFSNGAAWSFNNNFDKPTFSPSLVVRTGKMVDPNHPMSPDTMGERYNRICHSFIRNGMIQFLSDCTHELAGQTVPLLDVQLRN